MDDPDNIILVDDNVSSASSDTLDHEARSVTIENDSSSSSSYFLRQYTRTATPFTSLPQEVVDLTESDIFNGDYITDECLEVLLENGLHLQHAPGSPARSEPSNRKYLEEAISDGIVYKPGQSVELHDDTFLRIYSIWENEKGEIYFQGRRLLKVKDHIGTYLPQWNNELVWIANESADIPLELVRRFISICFTNHGPDQQRIGSKYLVCRLKEILRKETTSVEYLTYEEADTGSRTLPADLRRSWRGGTPLFGSKEYQSPVVILDDIENPEQQDLICRKYTFGDGFCGAGGVSCGAQTAGLHIKWAFDKSQNAAATYRLNFPTVECENSDIFSFLTNNEDYLRVDITHGSPPCQTWSPAHTIAGPNDDANSACIFSCGDLIRKAKPRVHTMEETSGLCERHKETFFGVIRDFIDIGYSVRWAVLKCMDYGVPQIRKRLVVIASGPGETLPLLPRATHGLPDTGLREMATINRVISNIPAGAPDHDVENARALNKVPYDGDRPAKTITCGGGDNYHPSGERGFTTREYACLQTFPISFRFQQDARQHIGNAVPPLFAKAVYGEIIRSLQETDKRESSP
ncbi:hypothetical protein ASPVEDRAFT_86163 [Aspergillus versicolor CBS 583.65]|uniref:DNA (cytosine-5-)-methyltransferase n=1 Tax=Aspergillus versicolor CBS 583.65 TaxID=1036611 RepID=A0A1L9PTF2_ASPVE|nr:uncharacterized protein ASPVEDRAFT_86163 [Aspergillus versicolor CBS 583.65]OJJ04781.1 hypothetical protein ASPVEDRAFT_86163 [Aspergillus versicolor CBS 583.65]